jgi:hypothetical protein
MPIDVKEYIDIPQRCAMLGIKIPEGFSILPRHFADAQAVSELCHESSAVDVQVLLREANVSVTVYQPNGVTIPSIQENDNTWVGPLLFFTASSLSANPELITVALGVISNYVTDLFRGLPGQNRAKLSLIIESETTTTTTTAPSMLTTPTPPSTTAFSSDNTVKISAPAKEDSVSTTSTTSKRAYKIDFDGPPDQLKEVNKIVKEIKEIT